MQNYFDREILFTERELTALKTSMQKSAGEIVTTSDSVDLNIPLSLDSMQSQAEGSVAYKITPSSVAMIFPTLNWYYSDITKAHDTPRTTREASCVLGRLSNGTYVANISVIGTQADVDALKGGSSVSVSIKLTVICSDTFTMEAF